MGNDVAQEGEEKKETNTDKIFKLIALLVNTAMHTGYPLKRWRKVANLMLEKIPGRPIITKLRIIHVFEADINLVLGILWG